MNNFYLNLTIELLAERGRDLLAICHGCWYSNLSDVFKFSECWTINNILCSWKMLLQSKNPLIWNWIFFVFFKFWLFLFKPWVWICLQKILLPNFWNDRFLSKPAAFFGKKSMICVYSCKFYTHQTAPITVRQSLVSLLHSVIFETCMKQKGACLQWYFTVWFIDICL